MVLESGATVEAAFGARPLYEADMLVRVKSAAINQAKTPMDVLEAIDQVIPFIELPDLLVQAPPKLNGAGVGAINVGARLGVAGAPLPVPVLRAERYAMLDALRDMRVTLQDASGATLGGGKGSDILEHPLNAVVWLAGALAQEGLSLQPGDLISLGSFSPLLPPKAGLSVTATYDGLPGAAPVRVTFK
jgi:2-keto-4-pentenoate hydratase